MSNRSFPKVSRRTFLKNGVLGASLFALPARLYAKYEAGSESKEVVLRFTAFSDTHLKKNADCVEADRLKRALEFMYAYSREQKYKTVDGMLVAGDFSDNGLDEELFLFKKIVDEGLKPETTSIFCMGNHEFHKGTKKRWEEIFDRPSNKTYEVKGFKFVGLSPEVGVRRNGGTHEGDYLYALEWFENEIKKACEADPEKPVFAFHHYHVTPTVYGSRGEDDWGIKDLYETLQRYPRVVDFSGHSHYPINDPRSAWQGCFTAFGTGTLSYFEMGGEGGRYSKFPPGFQRAAQLYVVEVHSDNSVVLKPYDLITNSFFDLVYVVDKPGDVDNYVYTDKRYQTSAKPVWAGGAKASVVNCEPSEVGLTFPQATCPDVVHSYRVDLARRIDDNWEKRPSQYFWSEYYFNDCPKEMRADLINLEQNAKYKLEITALNPFFKESEQKLTLETETPKSVVDKDAPFPKPDVLDVKFESGKAINSPVNDQKQQNELETFGAPDIVKSDDSEDTYVGIFNGVDDRYRIKFSERDYRRLTQGTVAARFKVDEYPTQSNGVVLGNTQGNGTSLEINPKTSCLEFWVGVNNQYVILSTPEKIELGTRHDAFGTYDGKAAVLYLDGKEVARKEVEGKMTLPFQEDVRAYCVGADITTGGNGSGYFKGIIARASVFSWSLTPEQIANLSR
ncbi:MAG: metallophosphoesterase [Thermoguttaceae bacterium]|nr:metallophosphoesterase [Thermoguttaceae bacterium]